MNSHAQIGIIGLGAMGQGLALNIAEKGYRISVFNRHLDGVEENVAQNFVAKSEHRETMAGFDELDSFIQSLATPRKILLLVSAGAAIDEVIESLTPFLKAGDLIIDGDEPFIDKVLDKAGQKGTGSWSVASAMDLGVPSSTISEALMARYLSGMKDERIIAEKKYNLPRKTFSGDKQKFINSVQDGYRGARIINHAIGFHLLREARSTNEWQAGLSDIARIWTKGCIIQSQLMVELVGILESDDSVLLHDDIVGHLQSSTPDLKQLVADGLDAGYALPVFSAALNYYLGYTQSQSPANLIQAQRYHFGSHPFERSD